MNDLTQRLTRLSAAEEFLEFFAIPFEQNVVNVSRLHILKRFYQYLRPLLSKTAYDVGSSKGVGCR